MAQGTTNLVHRDTGDGSILIWPWAYSSVTAGTWVFGISSAYNYYGFLQNSGTANDQIDYKVWLSKGYWNVALATPAHASMGIISLLLDSTVEASLEPVSSGSIISGFKRDIYVSTTGLHTISLKVTIGGTSGTSYCYVQYILLTRAN